MGLWSLNGTSKSSKSDVAAMGDYSPWAPEKTKELVLEVKLLVLKTGNWKLKIIRLVSDEEYKHLRFVLVRAALPITV